MGSKSGRPLLLVIESDPAVRRAVESAGREDLRFHFAESLSDRIIDRDWGDRASAPRVALIEVPDTRVSTLARLSRFREANPGIRIVLTACYDSDYQLAAERLPGLCDRIVFRPFEVEPVVRTVLGLAREEAVT